MAQTEPPIAITSTDNQVGAEVDRGLTALLDRTVARGGIHHAMFAIASGDKTQRWSGAAGPADADGTPLRPDTPFFIASITKRFTATLVLQAHERSELGLDDRIVNHLPAEATHGLHVLKGGRPHPSDHDPASAQPHLRAARLLRQAQGRRAEPVPAAGGRARPCLELDEMVRMAREDHRPHFPPQDLAADRQRARYSDTGFQLLIAIVERAVGRPYATLLSERIFIPLGLDHTWLPGRSEPAVPTVAPSQVCAKDRPLELAKMLESSNDLCSTLGDLLAFQRALIAGELFEHPATTALLTERSNLLRNMIPNRYGLGTWTFRVNRLVGPGRRPATLVGHAGATGTWLFHCPELDLHLAGTIDQTTFLARSAPFRLMTRMLRAWHG